MPTVQQLLTRFLACKFIWVLVARNHLHVLTLGYHLLKHHLALFWAFSVAQDWTLVSQTTEDLLALLGTLVFLVLGVVRVANTCANMAASQTEFARLSAAPLGGLVELFSTGDADLAIWMILTAQGQSSPNLVLSSQGVEDVAPQFDLLQHFTVANTEQAFLGPGQSYADTIWDAQEPNFALGIAANQGQQNNIVLLSLVLVHYMNLDPTELFGGHELAQAVELARVGGEDGDLVRLVLLQEEILTKSNHKLGFMLVLMAFPIFDLLLSVLVFHKEDIRIKALQGKN